MAFNVYSLVVALLMVATVWSKPLNSDTKCFPMKIESVLIGKVDEVMAGKGTVLDVIAQLSIDYDLGKQSLIESVFYNGSYIGNYHIIYTAKQSYFIDPAKKKCTPLPALNIIQVCSNSSFFEHAGQWTLGSQMTDTYRYHVTSAKVRSSITITRDTFTPVVQMLDNGLLDPPQSSTFQFGNVTEGIKDPKVFDPPAYCTSAKYDLSVKPWDHLISFAYY